MAALLLGLLVASAKSSHDARNGELTLIAANVILLDRALAHYGPATGEVRGILKVAIARLIEQLWSEDAKKDSVPSQGMGPLYDKIQELVPHSDGQRALQSQAESILVNVGQARLFLFAQSRTTISTPFLVVVVFWLSILFVSFGLFAPRNAIGMVTLSLAAISIARRVVFDPTTRSPVLGLD